MKMQETAQQYTQRILSNVDGREALTVQQATPARLKKLIRGLSAKQLKWKPEPGKWSIAEILAHLADAEIAGSWRMRLIVGASGTEVHPFDQDAWAAAFQYAKRDARNSVEVFRVLRENNLAMLKALRPEDWDKFGMHLERGKETIAHMTRMFAGHDTNHVRQIEGIVSQLTSRPKRTRK
ncbi:MAG TPA: DinB family protein [Candidatus Sulfotelmatobacter sp.]